MTGPDRQAIREVFAFLRVRDCAAAIAIYQRALRATDRFRLVEPSGRIGHVELRRGPAVLMLSDAFLGNGLDATAPGAPAYGDVHLHVDNAESVLVRAVAEGAEMLTPPTDQFCGERNCLLSDPVGNVWLIGHSTYHVTPEVMQRRCTALRNGT